MNDQPSREVWVYLEQRQGHPAEVSLELLCEGRKLADRLQGRLTAIIIGEQTRELAGEAFRHGAHEALVVQHPALRHYRTLPYARIMSQLVEERSPRVLLFGASNVGRDLAPRIASHTRSGLTADCTALRIADVEYLKTTYHDLLLQIRPAFGGNVIATIIAPDSPTQMATVREGVMQLCPHATPAAGRIIEHAYEDDELDDLVELLGQECETCDVDLKSARVIVAGGYGLGSKEDFQLVHHLAAVLGGEVAGSRAAVDAGFVPATRQVGQTGVTVRPKLYVAVGISGAIQHRAGMQESHQVVAINIDPEAPIFEVASHAVVGDAREVIPRLIEVYKQSLGHPENG